MCLCSVTVKPRSVWGVHCEGVVWPHNDFPLRVLPSKAMTLAPTRFKNVCARNTEQRPDYWGVEKSQSLDLQMLWLWEQTRGARRWPMRFVRCGWFQNHTLLRHTPWTPMPTSPRSSFRNSIFRFVWSIEFSAAKVMPDIARRTTLAQVSPTRATTRATTNSCARWISASATASDACTALSLTIPVTSCATSPNRRHHRSKTLQRLMFGLGKFCNPHSGSHCLVSVGRKANTDWCSACLVGA